MSNARNNAAKILGDISATSINAGQISGFKNRIINGTGIINQRNVSVTTASAVYYVDRWLGDTNLAITNFSYADDYSTSLVGPRHLYIQTISAKTTLAANDYSALQYRIEGQNLIDLEFGRAAAKPFTFSFRAISSTPGTFSLAFRNSNATRSYVTTVNLTSGAASYSVTVPGDTSGTWAVDNSVGMFINFMFAAAPSSAFVTSTLNTWQGANYLASSTQANGLDTVNRYVNITDVQLERGSVATPFENRSLPLELQLCKRYFHRIGRGESNNERLSTSALGVGTTAAHAFFQMPVQMRSSPSVIVNNIANSVFWDGTGNNTPTGYALDAATPDLVNVVFNVAGQASSKALQYTRLGVTTPTPSVDFSAEL
jgi:hypothetical protein